MELVNYGAFSADLHGRQAGKRVPLQVAIEVTRRCPLECLHCYNNLPMDDMDARRRELSKEEHFRVLDELVEMGCFWILYTGGEIFARKDFLEIYTYAKKKGFLITLFTNGTIMTEEIADYLAEWPPFAIEITLYGRTRKTYEALTGIPGSYDRCLRGIQLLKERKLPLKLKTVATSINKHEVVAMRRFAEEELGVEFKLDAQINPRIDCSQSPLAVRLKPEEVVALDLSTPLGQNEYRRLAQARSGRPSEPVADRYGLPLRWRCERLRAECLRRNRHLRDLAAGDLQHSYRWRAASMGAIPCTTCAFESARRRRSASNAGSSRCVECALPMVKWKMMIGKARSNFCAT